MRRVCELIRATVVSVISPHCSRHALEAVTCSLKLADASRLCSSSAEISRSRSCRRRTTSRMRRDPLQITVSTWVDRMYVSCCSAHSASIAVRMSGRCATAASPIAFTVAPISDTRGPRLSQSRSAAWSSICSTVLTAASNPAIDRPTGSGPRPTKGVRLNHRRGGRSCRRSSPSKYHTDITHGGQASAASHGSTACGSTGLSPINSAYVPNTRYAAPKGKTAPIYR